MLNKTLHSMCRSPWLSSHVAAIDVADYVPIPLLTAADISDILPGFQLWDCWPFETPDGRNVCIDGWTPWVIMCAPREVHPDLRHDIARLRLAMERDGIWRDCGYLLPDDLNPGSREWAGSTVYEPDTGRVILFYTVTGRRGEQSCTFEQRLFQAEGRLEQRGDLICVADWQAPVENVVSDGINYVVVDQNEGKPGFIKGFRDPFHFRDPLSGEDFLLFTGSLKPSISEHNGVIGIARSTAESFSRWELLPPIISADGVNNELERPMCRFADGLYYVFWSTQRKTFAPEGPTGPTGLYGMVAESLLGPYRPLNGSGLVAPNPVEEPFQTYSWWVDSNLNVTGFVDLWGLGGQDPIANPDLVERHFGGVLAPSFRIALVGDKAHIVSA
jgi:levansucrase